MKIGSQEFAEILVIGKDDELLATITDQDIVEKKDIRIVCVPPS